MLLIPWGREGAEGREGCAVQYTWPRTVLGCPGPAEWQPWGHFHHPHPLDQLLTHSRGGTQHMDLEADSPPFCPYPCLFLKNKLPSPGLSCQGAWAGHGGCRHMAMEGVDLSACSQPGRHTTFLWDEPWTHASCSEDDHGLLHVSQPKVQCCISGQLGV